MDLKLLNQKIDSLESLILLMNRKQDEFIEKALLKLSLTSKELYSLEECSEFLNISPKYVYQLVHAKKLKTSKKDGQKKHVFKKADLIDYLLNEDEKSTNEFEDDVVNGWNKKSK